MAGREQQNRKCTRILLVDDHPLIRERLTEVLEAERDLQVCGEAEDCVGALALIEVRQPGLVIVDLALKQSHGLDLIQAMRSRCPEVPALVLSMHDAQAHAERALRAGARGYLTKQQATSDILVAVRTVLGGGIYMPEAVRSTLAAKLSAAPRGKRGLFIDALTHRELRVFELIGEGFGTRDIAGQLHLEIRTIETYRARIKEKLHLKNATQLLQAAINWTQVGAAESRPEPPGR